MTVMLVSCWYRLVLSVLRLVLVSDPDPVKTSHKLGGLLLPLTYWEQPQQTGLLLGVSDLLAVIQWSSSNNPQLRQHHHLHLHHRTENVK